MTSTEPQRLGSPHANAQALRYVLRGPSQVAAQGRRATRLASALRARVARSIASREEGAATLERLHQDLVQSYTAGCLSLELAALTASDAARKTCLVRDAAEALARFERLSRIWSLLSAPDAEAQGPAPLHALLTDLAELYRTEARVLGVELVLLASSTWGVNAVGEAARRLAQHTEAAMRAAGAGGRVEIESSPDGSVTWRVHPRHAPASTRHLALR